MSRAIPGAVLLLACCIPVARAGDWDLFPELDLRLDAADASASRVGPDATADSFEILADAMGDLVWRRDLGNLRALDLDLGVAAARAREDGSASGPDTIAWRASVDADLPFDGDGWITEIAIGASHERTSIDFDGDELGDGRSSVLAAMLTHSGAHDRGCARSTMLLLAGHDDFDDERNGGDAQYDRSYDGGVHTFVVEFASVLGEFPESAVCTRTGPFRRRLYRDRTHLWGGIVHHEEPTRGALFDGTHRTLYFAGQTPLDFGGRVTLQWDVAFTASDYETRADDEALDAELAVGWVATPWLDVRGGTSRERRSSSIDGFDFDRWVVFAGVVIRCGGAQQQGPITEGSSTVARRRPSGSSAPRTEAEVSSP